MREVGALQEDGADGFRRRVRQYFEPLEDVWGPSDDDDIEDEKHVEDDGEQERMAERKCLGLTAEEKGCGEDDGASKHDEGVDRGADQGFLRLVYCTLEREDRDSLVAPGAGRAHRAV